MAFVPSPIEQFERLRQHIARDQGLSRFRINLRLQLRDLGIQATDVLGMRFSNCTAFRFDLVAASVSGDMAYTVGYEHTSVSIAGVPAEPYTLRVTHVYRRENGE